MAPEKIVVAFSGGLDTSYLVAYLRESTGAEIHTVTVDTGGFDALGLAAIEARALAVGAARHVTVDGRAETFDRVIRFLIQGNVARGSVYPLCVSAERVVQAERLVRAARDIGAKTVAHGSTGAGNDQVRFDVTLRTLGSELAVLAPIRDQGLSRKAETAWLRERGIPVEDRTSRYSINAGMWGVTIGGGETHDPWAAIPDEAYPTVVSANQAPAEGVELAIAFDRGTPVALDGERLDGPELVARLNRLGAAHGVGRGIHVGDTILGIKGRIAFEAPAAEILLDAHRELEKLVLTRWQQYWKDQLGDFYGLLVHEALFHDPIARDIEAFLASSQARVSGDVRVSLRRGILTVTGARSPFSLFDAAPATYGETQALWDGRDAEGFTRIYGLQGRLAAAAGGKAASGRGAGR